MTKVASKKILFILSILIISFVNVSFAQDSDAQKTFREGKKHFKKERYNLALPYFSSLQRAYPDNPNFNYCVGMCYYHTSSIYDSTIYYLTRATEQKDAITLYYTNSFKAAQAPAKAYYYLGIAYLRNNMSETAIRHFKRYQRYLNLEIKDFQYVNDDVNLQIQVCEAEKDYAAQQRNLRTVGRDSLINEIAFYKLNYEGSAQLLDVKNNDIINLMQELEAYNKTKNRAIGAPVEVIPDKITTFTIYILTSENELSSLDFSNISNVKRIRTADGLYHYQSGEFATREEAETRCREIRALGYPDAWVRPK